MLAEDILDELDLGGIGQLFALTSNDEVNTLAAMEFAHVFGRDRVYQLAPGPEQPSGRGTVPVHRRGRILFASGLTYATLSQQIANGAEIRVLELAEQAQPNGWPHGSAPTVPLFLVDMGGKLLVVTDDQPVTPRAGQITIALVEGSAQT